MTHRSNTPSRRLGLNITALVLVGLLGACGAKEEARPAPPAAAAAPSSTIPVGAAGEAATTTPTSASPSPTAATTPVVTAPLPSPLAAPVVIPVESKGNVNEPVWAGGHLLIALGSELVSYSVTGELEYRKKVCPGPSAGWADNGRLGPSAPSTVYILCGYDLTAVSVADGAVRWTAPLTAQVDNVSSDEKTVVLVVYGPSVTLRAFDVLTGAPRWERALEQMNVDVSVGQDQVYLADGEAVVALASLDGREIWSRPTGNVVLHAAEGSVFVIDSHRTMTALDPATGDERWTFGQPDPDMPAGGFVGITGGRVIVLTNHVIRAYDVGTGAFVWSFNDERVRQPKVTAGRGWVLVGMNDQLHILDAATGTTTRVDDGNDDTAAVGPGRYAALKGTTALVLTPLP